MKTKLLKILWLIAYLMLPVSFYALQKPFRESISPDPLPINLVLLFLVNIGAAYGLLISYAVHMLRNDSVDKKREPFWLLGFLVLGFIFVPLYWWQHVWPAGGETLNDEVNGRSTNQKTKSRFALPVTFATIVLFLVIGFLVIRQLNKPLTPQDVIERFEDAGLEVGEYRPLTEDEFRFLPYPPDEGIEFSLPSLGENQAGFIFYYEDEAQIQKSRDFLDELGGMIDDGRVAKSFVHENILVQMLATLDEATFAKYEAALREGG